VVAAAVAVAVAVNDGESNSRGKEGNDIVSHLSARL